MASCWPTARSDKVQHAAHRRDDNVLGINPAVTYPNFAGQPLYVLDNREKIRELV